MKNYFSVISLWVIIAAFIGLGFSYGNFYLFHLAGLAFVVAAVVNIKYIFKSFESVPFRNQAEILIAVMWLVYAVSIVWSVDKSLALYHNFYLLCGILILMAFRFAVNDINTLYRVTGIIGLIAGIEILIAWLEFYTSFRFPVSPYSDYVTWFGREQAYNHDLPAGVIDVIRHTPTGFRWNPNNLAVLMLIIIPFFVFSRHFLIKTGATLASVAVIIFTGSRGSLIALALMAAVYYLFFIKLKARLILLGIAGITVLIIALNIDYIKTNHEVKYREISTTALALNNYLFENHEEINDTSSIAIRQNLIRNGMGALKETYGLGVGAGNSVYVQMQHSNTHNTYSMHNFWVEVLVEGGIIAFAIWLFLYVYILYRLIVILRKRSDKRFHYFARSCILALTGLAVGIISISSAIYFFPMWILLGLSLATIRNAARN